MAELIKLNYVLYENDVFSYIWKLLDHSNPDRAIIILGIVYLDEMRWNWFGSLGVFGWGEMRLI